jgi:hypothetical protein
MARVRSLLLRIDVRPAGKLSRCSHNKKHAIPKGELRFIVKDQGPAGGEKGYCVDCAAEMLDASEAQLEELRKSLEL